MSAQLIPYDSLGPFKQAYWASRDVVGVSCHSGSQLERIVPIFPSGDGLWLPILGESRLDCRLKADILTKATDFLRSPCRKPFAFLGLFCFLSGKGDQQGNAL